MPSAASETIQTLQVPVDQETKAGIEAAAARYGLQPSSYLLMLHALHQGKVAPDVLSAVRELYTHDRQILEALAK